MEESEELNLEIVENLKHKSKQFLENVEKEIYEKNKLNDEFVSEWVEKHKDDEFITDLLIQLENLVEEVFRHDKKNWTGSIPHIKCKAFPVNVNSSKRFKEEDYIQVYRKAMAKFRHEIYKLVKSEEERGRMGETGEEQKK